MKQWLYAVGRWLDTRLSLRESLGPILTHPVPRALAGPKGWWYVFGSASMTLLMIQIVTGVGLALVYVPAADQAYESLLFLDYDQPLCWFMPALHYYAGSGMVVMVLAHMTQVFIIPGVLLFFLADHLWLVVKRWVRDPPVPGEPVDPKNYDAKYEQELKT